MEKLRSNNYQNLYRKFNTQESFLETLLLIEKDFKNKNNLVQSYFLPDNIEYYKNIFNSNQIRNKLGLYRDILGYSKDQVFTYNPIESEIFPFQINGNIMSESNQQYIKVINTDTEVELETKEIQNQYQFIQDKELNLTSYKIVFKQEIQLNQNMLVINFIHPLRLEIEQIIDQNNNIYTDFEQYNQLGITAIQLPPIDQNEITLLTKNIMTYNGIDKELVLAIQHIVTYNVDTSITKNNMLVDKINGYKLLYQDENHSYYEYFYLDNGIIQNSHADILFIPAMLFGVDIL